MLALPCTAEEIHEINQKKEYTLISTQLMEYLLQDPKINAEVNQCWQTLFRKARFHSNLEVTISYVELAENLSKSKRTVMRYVKILKEAGYLIVKQNSDAKSGLLANTFLVRVPTSIIKKISNTEDRAVKKSDLSKKKDNDASHLIQALSDDGALNQEIALNRAEDKRKVVSLKEGALWKDCAKERSQRQAAAQAKDPSESKSKETSINVHSISEEETASLHGLSDKSIATPYDRHATSYNNKYLNNKNNNRDSTLILKQVLSKREDSKFLGDCCCDSTNAEKIFEIEREIVRLQDAEKRISLGIKPGAMTYAELQKTGAIRSQIDILEMKREHLKKEEAKKAEIVDLKRNLKRDDGYMANRGDKNRVSSFTFKRLVKELKHCGRDDEWLPWLINEIIYEVRFGSLRKSKTTGKRLSLDHGINIALKLVREGRWTTPMALRFDKKMVE
ncbi:MAG: HTH domain-containing protein [Proteobacteria bacterium]|nr:HTH domain-containing protein [Pseudomonadota bacterium]